MKIKLLYLSLLMILVVKNAGAQHKRCALLVQNENKEPLVNVTVEVKSQAGQSITAGFTDSIGKYVVNNSVAGTYTIKISNLGYIPVLRNIELGDQPTELVVTMKVDTILLGEVIVTATKTLIVRKDDKLILNIDGKNTLGSTAIDILRNAPGVSLENDNLILLGKDVSVEIDGKPLKFTQQQLQNYLRNKAAGGIKQIELVANPDASYASSFEGRVINIITRREGEGYTASVSTNFTQRATYPSEWMGASINYFKGKVNLYSNINYANTQMRSLYESNLKLPEEDMQILENNRNNSTIMGPQYELGIDLYLTPISILGFKINGYFDKASNNLFGGSNVYINNQLDTSRTLNSDINDKGSMNNINLNYKVQLDSVGTTLNFDFDYGSVTGNYFNNQVSNSYAPDNSWIDQTTINQHVNSNNKLYALKADYNRKLGEVTMATGVHFTGSDIQQDLEEQSPYIPPGDDGKGKLIYKERVYAVYTDFRKNFKSLGVGIGLRGELTNYEGRTDSSTVEVGDIYFNLFPQVRMSYNLKGKHYFSAAWRRSISRPRFQDLIPFKRYNGNYQYYIGNPFLLPYFPSSVELYYSFKNSLYTIILYRQAKNRILEFDQQLPNSNVIESSRSNNGTAKRFTTTVGYNKNIKSWLLLGSSVSYLNGLEEFTVLDTLNKFNYNAFTVWFSPTFTIKRVKIIPNFYYSSDVYYNASKTLSYWYLDLTTRYSFLKDKAEVSLGVRDIFLTGISRRVSDYGGINLFLRNNWDSRQFFANFNYYFGNEKVKASRKRGETANQPTLNRF